MKTKMRASLITMLLLFFTLVLFYQNCSQEGSGIFTSGNPPPGGGNPPGGTSGVGTFGVTLKAVNPTTNQEVVVTDGQFIYPENIKAEVNYGQGNSSVIVCGAGPGDPRCMNSVPNIVLNLNEDSSASSGCDPAKLWTRLDCTFRIQNHGWVIVGGGTGMLNQDITNLGGKVVPGCNGHANPVQFDFHFKPNNGSTSGRAVAALTYRKLSGGCP